LGHSLLLSLSDKVASSWNIVIALTRLTKYLHYLMVNLKEYVMGKTIETGFFKNGKKDGEWITYNKKGALIRKINYSDGQLNGTCEVFSANGTPKLNAFFNGGEKSGKWTYFTSNGKIFMTGEFESGKPINTWTINDKRGKAPVIQYDYNSKKYLINQPLGLYKDNDVIQNDNTKEYYILRYQTDLNW
jgi:antitoxin component YwqK of YwqJK toxin-antitoxin module